MGNCSAPRAAFSCTSTALLQTLVLRCLPVAMVSQTQLINIVLNVHICVQPGRVNKTDTPGWRGPPMVQESAACRSNVRLCLWFSRSHFQNRHRCENTQASSRSSLGGVP